MNKVINQILTIMKRLFLFSIMTLLYGCMMIAQIPRQYVYVDENCEASLPDFSDLVVVYDNCGAYELFQTPVPGTMISTETEVTMLARDLSGNEASASFYVSILDTIPPNFYYNDTMIVQLNPEWKGYTDQEVSDMYRTFYGWIQYNNARFNELYADTEIFVELSDTSFTTTIGEVKIYENMIMIPDTIIDSSWWWAIVE
jgi:hypothetical protein